MSCPKCGEVFMGRAAAPEDFLILESGWHLHCTDHRIHLSHPPFRAVMAESYIL